MYFVFCYVEQFARDYANEPGGCWMHLLLAFLVRTEYVLNQRSQLTILNRCPSQRRVYICLLCVCSHPNEFIRILEYYILQKLDVKPTRVEVVYDTVGRCTIQNIFNFSLRNQRNMLTFMTSH